MELLRLARGLTHKRRPQHARPDGAPEHGKGFARQGGIRLGDRIEAVSLDERFVVAHLPPPLAGPLRFTQRPPPVGSA
jgi:hypothetical protein